MNFFDGKLISENGAIHFDGGDFTMTIPDELKSIYESHAGKDVTFGIRPEDIHNPDFVPSGITTAKVAAKVEVTELMGNEIFVYLNSGSHQSYIARVDPRSNYSYGQDVEVAFNMDNFHIFDKGNRRSDSLNQTYKARKFATFLLPTRIKSKIPAGFQQGFC